MIRAAMTVMALTMRRDMPALLLIFVLPPLVFVVFTAVFREATTRVPAVTVAILDVTASPRIEALTTTLTRGGLRLLPPSRSEDDLRARVAVGALDVGVIDRKGDGGAPAAPDLVVLKNHDNDAKIVQSHLAEAFAPGAQASAGAGRIVSVDPSHGDPVVLGEIGAIGAMFLMLAAIQIAATLVDERQSGIHERIAASGDVAGLVLGKLGFGLVVGTIQAALVLVTAMLVFGAGLSAHPLWLAIACVLTAAMASSLTLLIAACCSTRHQAQTISTFAVLVASALGGSMVPFKMMPTELAEVSRLMPNAWSIAAFDAALGMRGSVPPYGPWAALAGVTIAAALLAVWAFRRRPLL